MKKAFLILLTALSISAYSQSNNPTFDLNVKPIDTTKKTTIDITAVRVLIGNRFTEVAVKDGDTTRTTYVNITTYASGVTNSEGIATITRSQKIPATLYDSAFDGFDPVTNKPRIKLSVLAMLLAPFNLKIK